MALLPEDPQSQVKLLVVILSVAAGALYFNFIHSPGGLEIVEMADRAETLETQNELAEARIGNLQRLRDELGEAEGQLRILERLVPAGTEVPEIYEAIATESQSRNLQLLSIEPLTPAPADSAGSLMRQEWSLVVEGSYHSIGRFLANVASFERIVRPRVSEISPSGNAGSGRQLVQAMLSLETFVLSPETEEGDGGSGDGGGDDDGESDGESDGAEGGGPLVGGG